MAKTMNRLSKKIMRRVYIIYAIRALGGMRTAHSLLMAVCLFGLVRFVSVVDVITNASQAGSAGQFGDFMVSAVAHTEVWTLVALLGFAVVAFSFVKNMSASRAPQFA